MGARTPTSLSAEPRPAPAGPGASVLRRTPGWLVAGVIYALGSVAMWWQVWSGHPSSTMTCACGDPSSFVWFLAWPAYAISHGHSLFFATRLHYPTGINLLDNTSVLALGVVLAPVTWLFGPIATLNVALTATPLLTGLSAYAVLRRGLGLGRTAAFLGGLAFGFSPFMLRNEAANHLQTSFLALVPLIFWCCYELAVVQRGRWWRWGLALGLLVAVQFFVGTDILLITAMTTAIALVLGLGVAMWRQVRNPDDRALTVKLPYAWRGFGLAVVVGVVLLAYPLWFSLAGPEHIAGMNYLRPAGNGVLQVLLPLGASISQVQQWPMEGYLGPVGTYEAYLGIPALLVVAAALLAVRRPLVKMCAVMTVITLWLSLGGAIVRLSSGGEPHWFPLLPWGVLMRLPVLDKSTPATFSATAVWFVAVAGAMLVDRLIRARTSGDLLSAVSRSALTRTAGARVLSAGVIGAALVLPWLFAWPVPFTAKTVTAPAWVTGAGARLPANAVVLFNPFPSSWKDSPELWQARYGLPYAVVGGRGIVAGKNNAADHGWTPGTPEGIMTALSVWWEPHLRNLPLPALPDSVAAASFRSALQHWGVTNVVVTVGGRDPSRAVSWLKAALGTAPQSEDGAWVWNNVQKLIS
jgi:hypothetical protein